MHLEAWADFPLKGSPYKSYGASVVFRPQIYRFDLFTRLKMEYATFNLSSIDSSNNGPWDLELQWILYGAEFGIYF